MSSPFPGMDPYPRGWTAARLVLYEGALDGFEGNFEVAPIGRPDDALMVHLSWQVRDDGDDAIVTDRHAIVTL